MARPAGPSVGKLAAPGPHRGRLFRKYVVIFVVLVSGGLLTSGLIEFSISYQQSQIALARLQREKAVAAAATIEQFIRDIQRQIN